MGALNASFSKVSSKSVPWCPGRSPDSNHFAKGDLSQIIIPVQGEKSDSDTFVSASCD